MNFHVVLNISYLYIFKFLHSLNTLCFGSLPDFVLGYKLLEVCLLVRRLDACAVHSYTKKFFKFKRPQH